MRVPAVSDTWKLTAADSEDAIMWQSFQVTRKATHSLIVHSTDISTGDVALQKDTVGKMPVLTADMYEAFEQGIAERVDEVLELQKAGQIDFIAKTFPSLIDQTKKKPALLFSDSTQLLSKCTQLISSSFQIAPGFGPKHSARTYDPAKQIARNDRVTLFYLLDITPEQKRAKRGLLGGMIPKEIRTIRKKRKGGDLDERPKKRRRENPPKSS